MDITNKQCNIYNMDHSLYKNVPLTVPDGYYLYNVQFLSEKIFNSDDLIELVYTSSYSHQTETSYYYSYETRVINENGDVLLYVPGAGYTLLNDAGEEGMKFLPHSTSLRFSDH